MTDRPVSPTMAALIEQLNKVRAQMRESEEDYNHAIDAETEALGAYDKAHAISMLQSEKPTEGLRQAEAVLATEQQALQKRLTIGLRRSASEAGKNARQEAKVLEAAFHAYNREIKSELELAGKVT